MTRLPHAGVPRALLRDMREVMGERVSPLERLGKLVRMVAANMVAEVCSVYLLRNNTLVLTATEGLNPDAVGRTSLKLGEGLVGEIARTAQPLNLIDAPSHPKFAYRPETGEDPFQSFLGVPILRSGRTLGVLVVQNVSSRSYTEEEMEALETIAVVLAEVAAAGDLADPSALGEAKASLPQSVRGLALADGISIGHAVLHEPRVKVQKLIAEDVVVEMQRLDRAIEDLRASIDQMVSAATNALTGEPLDVLETYRMFANDRGWITRMREAVLTGLTAEAAVERVQNQTRARMQRQTNPYFRERYSDLDDLANRLLRMLAGLSLASAAEDLPTDAIVFARTIGPAELLDYEHARLRGLVLEEGSPTAHASIVARALGIPMVGRARDVLDKVEPGDLVVLDGEHGEVHLRPGQDLVKTYDEKLAFRAQRRAQYDALRGEPAVTTDGARVNLLVNAGLLVDLPHLEETGAEGVGLFRTELQFMVAAQLPRRDAQRRLYRSVLEAAGNKPVVFRTLDLGGDKVLPYLDPAEEENPALGWRAVRIALDRPRLLRYQLQALLAAAEGFDLRVMFPMVAEVSEFRRARGVMDDEIERFRRLGKPLPRSVRVGTMLEVPSLLWQLDALLPAVDFISVGSNDLAQFLFAADRGNPRLAERYDNLSPALLKVLRHLAVKANAYGVPLTLCGEMAGSPLEAMALVGLGFRAISMPPAAVGPVKVMIRSLNAQRLEAFMEDLYDLPDHSVREHLSAFAGRNDVTL